MDIVRRDRSKSTQYYTAVTVSTCDRLLNSLNLNHLRHHDETAAPETKWIYDPYLVQFFSFIFLFIK